MRGIVCFIVLLLVSGCVSQSTTKIYSEKNVTPKKSSEIEADKEDSQRISYLKTQAQLMGKKLVNFYEMDSVFTLMGVIQDGRVTTDELPESMFFFKNSLGIDNGALNLSSYFLCAQVVEMGEIEADKRKVYKGLYTNPHINMTISVVWTGIRPLQGQKLNIDFLEYYGVDQYTNSEGNDRTEVIFFRPVWVGRNGYSGNKILEK